MQAQFLRVNQVANALGMSAATVWRKAKTDPKFPKAVKVSDNITAWPSEDVQAYRESLIAACRSAA